MEIRQLRYFVTTANLLSYTKAAKVLFISQPALSNSISRLEKELGTDLFYRGDSRGIRLTPAGRIFLKDAQEILQMVEASVMHVRNAGEAVTGSLSVGYLSAPVFQVSLPDWISGFRTEYPGIDLSIDQYNSTLLYEALETMELDIGFCMSTDLHGSKSLCSAPILHDHISLVCRSDHPIAAADVISLKDLGSTPVVMLSNIESSGFYDKVMQLCLAQDYIPNIVKTSKRREAVSMMVRSGIGVTFLPDSTKMDEHKDLKYLDIANSDNNLDILAAWNKNNQNPAISAIRNYLENHVQAKNG